MQFFEKNYLSIYFIGIGGTGNSALAFYLKRQNFRVAGSDVYKTEVTVSLQRSGIDVFYDRKPERLKEFDVVVYSSAIPYDDEELKFATENKFAVYSRAELLSLIMSKFDYSIGVCGSHGKTTTTALIANILRQANYPFTAFIGGFDKNLSNNCSFGNKAVVAEICEYKRNIDLFKSDLCVILNVDDDHLECYNNDFKELSSSFENYSKRSFKTVLNADDNTLVNIRGDVITFGKEAGDYRAGRVKSRRGKLSFKVFKRDEKLFKIKCDLIGDHNVLNVLAAVAAAKELNIKNADIKRGIAKFRGIARRNEFLGKIENLRIIADYAHHPEELKRTIEAYIKAYKNKVVFVFEPHTYTRTKTLFNEFIEVFKPLKLFFLYKTFPAREEFDEGGDALTLAKALPNSVYESNFSDLLGDLKCTCEKTRTVVILGAGSLYYDFKNYIKKDGR